jgi:hypothetical protein
LHIYIPPKIKGPMAQAYLHPATKRDHLVAEVKLFYAYHTHNLKRKPTMKHTDE